MAFRLINENEPSNTLSITNDTWFGILDLAEEYGWTPMGTVMPGQWDALEIAMSGYYLDSPYRWNGHAVAEETRLVLIEDALNMADALDDAFMEYEHIRVPASFYLFEPSDPKFTLRPSIGAIAAVIDFCRSGAFWIERYQRPVY